MYSQSSGLSLLEQKRLQWAREREEMVGLSGLWGTIDNRNRQETPLTSLEPVPPRRNSLLPPIQSKTDEQKEKEEESETSGYLSDSPQHDCDSSTDGRSQVWSVKRDNYWGERKFQKNMRNECRLRGTPDSVLSTPDDRLKWGDRGVGVGHLWEPVVELPESRLPQVFESYRATPRWLERKLADNKAEILVINHDDEDDGKPPSNFLLGQNAPLPPEILEERERKRKRALELQNAIRRQLEEREKKRKDEKEERMREERKEEERIMKERELERLRREEETRKLKEKEDIERKKEEAMKEALEAAERLAKEERRKQKIKESAEGAEERKVFLDSASIERSVPMKHTPRVTCHHTPRQKQEDAAETVTKEQSTVTEDTSSQVSEDFIRRMTDSSSQSESTTSLQFLNMGGMSEGGLALVLESSTAGGVLVPHESVQLLLMSPGQAGGALPVHVGERVMMPSIHRRSNEVVDAVTQTDRKCCSVTLSSERSHRSRRRHGRTTERTSGRSETSEKSSSLELLLTRGHTHCTSSYKHRSRSQPRTTLGDRPKWGINRPSVQYMKQSEKDPHYLRRLKRRRRTKEAATSTAPEEKLLDSEFRLLPFHCTDDEGEKEKEFNERVLENGFRMLSNPSSPKFVRIGGGTSAEREFEVTTVEDTVLLEYTVNSTEENNYRDSVDQKTLFNEEEINLESSILVDPSIEPQPEVSPSVEDIETIDLNGTSENKSQEIIISYSDEELKPDTPEAKTDETSSAPSTGRSVSKSDENDGDDDFEDDDEDNRSVVSASIPNMRKSHDNAIYQLNALKKGLQRLMSDVDSRCSTPGSSISEVL